MEKYLGLKKVVRIPGWPLCETVRYRVSTVLKITEKYKLEFNIIAN